jgi:hypothetical protein
VNLVIDLDPVTIDLWHRGFPTRSVTTLSRGPGVQDCPAACFETKQAVGNADRGDDRPDMAQALHQEQNDQVTARDLNVSRNRC